MADFGRAGELVHVYLRGNPAHEEVAFVHVVSRTLVVADLVGNLPRPASALARLAASLNGWGQFGPARALRFMVRDRAAFRESLERLLALDFDRIVMAHGAILESGGQERLKSALGRYL